MLIGQTCIWIACVVALAAFILLFLGGLSPFAWPLIAALFALLIVPPMLLIGVALLTRPDPRLARVERSMAHRNIVRTSAVLAVVTTAIEITFAWLTNLPNWVMLARASRIASVSLLVISGLLYASKLAQRMPNEKLSGRARDLARELRVLIPLYYAAKVWESSAGGPFAGGFGSFVSVCSVLLGLVLVVRGVRAMALMEHYRGALRGCLAEARSLDQGRQINADTG